jgi:manganese/zinc/iron transport system substrate-binding protein
MIGDITREIAGDKATVVNLIGEGVDPHVYKPTKGDIDQFQSAALIFYNGLLLEGKMGEVLESQKKAGKPVYAVAEDLPDFDLIGGTSHADPHLWMDVSAWVKVTRRVAEELGDFDPTHNNFYQENQAKYENSLIELHAYARRSLASIPEGQRVLVTAHDAFSYLGRAYGMEVRGIQGISTESEAGLQEINSLVSYLVENRIPSIFVESSVSDKSVKALIEGAKSRGHIVRIGGTLYSDAMGPAGTYEGTYLGMIDHNVTLITRALGGNAPATGYQNKLEATGE